MPIFQDDLEQASTAPGHDHDGTALPEPAPLHPFPSTTLSRKLSEESIRTELCEGPVPDSPKPTTPERDSETLISDRAEFIERLKRGESPTWIPNRHLESIFRRNESPSARRSPRSHRHDQPSLLPAASITGSERGDTPPVEDSERLQEGLNIERPRSALHSGNFTPEESSLAGREAQGQSRNDSSGHGHYGPDTQQWIATSPPRDFAPFEFKKTHGAPGTTSNPDSGLSSLSSSISSSFVYKPPTSPLVQSESNDEVDLSLPLNSIDIASNGLRNPRRHTMASQPSPLGHSVSQRIPPHRREGSSHPYQAHQPRRSLTATPSFDHSTSSPQTPVFLRTRRPSFSSDMSPIQHASMVGSYEESILRGRMSTTPSKPLDFMAQIGVLGLGKCKPSLRCPPHVTLPFPAVFYSYASTPHRRSKDTDGPSPYVGQIDLENNLPNAEDELRAKRKHQTRHAERGPGSTDVDMIGSMPDPPDRDLRMLQKQKRRTGSPRAPPGGGYRIPEKGQVQIIIKNQNKTAVKLFLVPYDLSGMEAGTKTFIRQKSYSAGPIMEEVPALQDNVGAERPILRYLVHLHICCPSRGRFYLYRSIRVVFANRVPDGKEKLRNEITLPEPKFTPYKPVRVMQTPMAYSSGPGAMLAAEKAFRRRSSGISFGPATHVFGAMDGVSRSLHAPSQHHHHHHHHSPASLGGNNTPVDPAPFRLPSSSRLPSTMGESGEAHAAQMRSPESSSTSRPVTQDSADSSPWDGPGVHGFEKYDKLSKGDVGYGGNAFAPPFVHGSPGAAEGLLSKRLKSLGVQTQQQPGGPAEDVEG